LVCPAFEFPGIVSVSRANQGPPRRKFNHAV
jgi:hypothetical protein